MSVILEVTAAFALVSVAAAFLLPKWYTASARILPPQQSQSLASSFLSQFGGVSSLAAVAGKDLGLKNPNDLYVSMLKSRTVADALVQRFKLQAVYGKDLLSDARKKLEKCSDISDTRDGLIRIAVQDRDPKRAAAMANEYVDQLRRMTAGLALTEAAQRRLFFDLQLQKAKESLAVAEQSLRETQQRTGLIQLDSQAKAIIESVASVRGQIAAKELALRSMRTYATDQNAGVVLAQQELAAMRQQLSKLERQQNAGSGDLHIPTNQIPEVGLEYLRALREVKYNETIFELLAKQYEIAKVDEAKQGSVIQVIDSAIVPDRHSWPTRWLLVLVSTIVGLLGSVLFVCVRAGFEQVRHTPEERVRLDRLKALFTGKA
jgi:uncharacterized protein involved in exopolysaccharide biosynthesis